ncbi:YrrS family protein [Salimicrobium flavidum]|uniref:DUF1510 domain-containing protein n=1 Tax=Salimicrobium flavidum TaxID=570947 RepID=A0A1N7II19_9BACI|nr:YrrS family protein [Salimicrobium flavidum]SIS36737.1 Protein of unknown function [Salimicrobium flavidum]
MDEQAGKSRRERMKHKRNNKKLLSFLTGILAAVLVLWAAGSLMGSDEEPESSESTNSAESETENTENQETASEESTGNQVSAEQLPEEASEEEGDSEEYVIENSSNDNVSRVVKKEWETIDTKQDTSGRHVASFDRESTDWNEILQAVSVATELKMEDMITWRVENGGGPQLVSAVVSDSSQDNVYRVRVEWQKKEGYKPVQLEILKDNPYN